MRDSNKTLRNVEIVLVYVERAKLMQLQTGYFQHGRLEQSHKQNERRGNRESGERGKTFEKNSR